MPLSSQLALTTARQQAEHFGSAIVVSMWQAVLQIDRLVATANQAVDRWAGVGALHLFIVAQIDRLTEACYEALVSPPLGVIAGVDCKMF